MRPTLVSIHHHQVGDVQIIHGDEIAPGLLDGELLDQCIDRGWVREMPERRSLHRLFAPFSGCAEREQLSRSELDALTLPA